MIKHKFQLFFLFYIYTLVLTVTGEQFCFNETKTAKRMFLAAKSLNHHPGFNQMIKLAVSEVVLNSNNLLNTRLPEGMFLSSYVDPLKISLIAEKYIQYLDHLFESVTYSKLKVKILYHDDMDGVASAILVEAFLTIYSKYSGKDINFILESRSAFDKNIGNISNIDLVFAVDLFWSREVAGIDLAIDHHRGHQYDLVTVDKDLLVNLDSVGYIYDSNYLPASVLSLMVFDYILRIKGISFDGMLSASYDLSIGSLLDGAILGDNAVFDDLERKGFYVFNMRVAKAVQYLATLGRDSLQSLFSMKNVAKILLMYQRIYPLIQERSIQIYQAMKNYENVSLKSKLLNFNEVYCNNQLNMRFSRGIYDACCSYEKKIEKKDRSVLMFGYIEENILTVSLRYDGSKDLNILSDILKLLEYNVSYNSKFQFYQKLLSGGGHNKSMIIRFDLSGIKNHEEAFDALSEQISFFIKRSKEFPLSVDRNKKLKIAA